MTTEDRRSTDREFERVWHAIDELVKQLGAVATGLATHSAVCTRDQQTRESDRRAMRAALDRLVQAADRRDWTRKLVRWAWGGVVAASSALVVFWDHVGAAVLRWLGKGAVVLVILLASAAMAHDDDHFLRELQTPTGGSCCSERDCSLTDDWDQKAGAYVVKVEGEWREVPADIVIRGKPPHPSGRAVLCVLPAGQTICFLPGATGV